MKRYIIITGPLDMSIHLYVTKSGAKQWQWAQYRWLPCCLLYAPR